MAVSVEQTRASAIVGDIASMTALSPLLPSNRSPMLKLDLKGHVGIETLPEQYVEKMRSRGFSFNLLCVGETGIGKSTLMESLFNMRMDNEPCSGELKEAELRSSIYNIQEGCVTLKLTVVETAGFGDQLDKESSTRAIFEYIENQYKAYLQEELRVKRSLDFYDDKRVHACIYFISPTGHGLKTLDVSVLKELTKKVNVIPVIAKADTISKEDLKRFKEKINSDFKQHGIEVYRFPTSDEASRAVNEALNAAYPFAVIGSSEVVMKGNKKCRARTYPWGIVEVENTDHCDFVKLREALLRVNVEDLRERTHSVLYETFRREQLKARGFKEGDLGEGLQQKLYMQRQEIDQNLQNKRDELNQEYMSKARVVEAELKVKERSIQEKFEAHKRKMNEWSRNLDAQRQKLEMEKREFDRKKQQYMLAKAKGKVY